ncbi:MAG: acyl-CoA dehydrogenase family protein [Pseudomonadota bacterium]
MDLTLNKEDEDFREEVKAFLNSDFPADLRKRSSGFTGVFHDYDVNIEWHRILYKKGWAAPNWPVEYGGTGWSVMQKYIWAVECAEAGTPSLSPLGLKMCGPAIMGHGSQEQKDYFLPRILSGEDYWCQGYSEPNSGSDLASLQMKAESDGDDYILNGSKIWTTHAHFANRIFCLVRTSQEGKKQQGISFLLVDMDSPGIKVEPIITLAGDHEVNQVFFDNVRVPKSRRVGEENKGWTVAKYLLEFERGGTHAAGLKVGLRNLKSLARNVDAGQGEKLYQDNDFRRKLTDAERQIRGIEISEHQIFSAMSQGQNPGAVSSTLKIHGSETSQQLTDLAVEALGYISVPVTHNTDQSPDAAWPKENATALPSFLNRRAATIYGGSNEVQRNIIAKVILGLE